MQHQAPSVRPGAEEENVRDLDLLLSLILRAVSDGRASASPNDTRKLADIGAACASRGYPLADFLIVYRIVLRVIVNHIREVGCSIGSESADVLDMVDLVLGVGNTVTAAVAAGYYTVEPRWQAVGRERAEFVRGLLWGTVGSVELDRHTRGYGIDAEREYVALRARPMPGGRTDDLARAHGFTFGRAGDGGLSAVVDGDLVGFLTAAPTGYIPGVSGIGPPRPLERLHESFRMASRALDIANRRNLRGVHEFGELGLLPAMFSDDAIGEALCRRYLDPLGDNEFAVEIVDTLRAYLIQGMHVAQTAARMFVHPNTVRYRINRFEELTDVSLRSNPATAFEVLWAVEHWSTRSERPRDAG